MFSGRQLAKIGDMLSEIRDKLMADSIMVDVLQKENARLVTTVRELLDRVMSPDYQQLQVYKDREPSNTTAYPFDPLSDELIAGDIIDLEGTDDAET